MQQAGSHSASTEGGDKLFGLNGPELLGPKQSSDPLVDPAWICAQGPLLHAQVENSSFESCWEEGLYSVSTVCPLMGYPCQDLGEEGSPAGRSSDLVESVSRSPEVVAPEALQILANVSRFEIAPSDDCSFPIFSIFGWPLLIGRS